MMVPVQSLARFMATGDGAGLEEAFAADGVVILENFAPFLFGGRDAFVRWRDGFGLHVKAAGLSGLKHAFGPAQDLALAGDTAFFVLPTTWTGRAQGEPFSEDGGWAFVLQAEAGRWRILSYAWAVTSKS